MKIKNDQFFTKTKIANSLIERIDSILIQKNLIKRNLTWIEPSAGNGNFVDELKKYYPNLKKIKSFDIDKKRDFIKEANFLKDKIRISKSNRRNNIIIGNPPFGRRAKLAIEFINKSFEYSDVICFILPNQFKRYLTQKKINENLKLVFEINLEKNSFLLESNKDYNVNCVFQIWVNKRRRDFKNLIDQRIHTAPQIKTNDFDTFIHNNTLQTLKYFNKEMWKWDIALYRQGYYNYSKIFKREDELIKNIQYLFIKFDEINYKHTEKIIKRINLKKLSQSNTTIPGYSLSDFVKKYKEIKNCIENEIKIEKKIMENKLFLLILAYKASFIKENKQKDKMSPKLNKNNSAPNYYFRSIYT